MAYESVIFSSYGNDSCALIQWAYEQALDHVAVVFSDTGWAVPWWIERVEKAEAWVRSLGFDVHRTESEGMEGIVRRKKGWPAQQFQWCTTELKILPAQRWLDEHDPGRWAVCMAGIRREESRGRTRWPESVGASDKHGGRPAWFPLVRHTEEMRNDILSRTPFEPLPHRSMECFPCINANRADLRLLGEERVAHIETIEEEIGHTMFRPAKHMGEEGIRRIMAWAHSDRGKHVKGQESLFEIGCDSGFCGS